jgi:methyl-accepting chemotaxis protein
MFKNLRLGSKIGLGFGVVIMLLSIILGVGVFALQRADEGISEYTGGWHGTLTCLECCKPIC